MVNYFQSMLTKWESSLADLCTDITYISDLIDCVSKEWAALKDKDAALEQSMITLSEEIKVSSLLPVLYFELRHEIVP